jgi:uncharacterized protein
MLTEECNFRCSYCYQKKDTNRLDIITLEKALDFFLPFLEEECYISFYGGEPLLEFEKIKYTIQHLQKKDEYKKNRFQFSFTTNGSLIKKEIIQFLEKYKFSILLSFDGLAQEIHRQKGSFTHAVSVMNELVKHPDIEVETNSVFTPESVGYLSRSVRFIHELGISNIHLAFSSTNQWDVSSLLQLEKELKNMRIYLLSSYKKTGKMPVSLFRKKVSKGIFGCYAGKDRMALTPDGKLWGCYLFFDYFKQKEDKREYGKYCYGGLDAFIENHEKIYPEILSNYKILGMNHFFTDDDFCMLCEELEDCAVCPIDAGFSGSILGKIPIWICQIRKLIRKEKNLFWEEIEAENKS